MNSFQPIVASLVVFDGLCRCGCAPPPTRTRLRFNSIPLRSDQPRVSWLGILVGSRATMNVYIYIRKRRYAIPVTPRRNDRRDEKSSPVSPRLFWNDRKIEEKIDTISQTIGKHDSSAILGIFIASSSASNPSCVREMKLLLLPMRRCRRRPVNRRDDISIVW